MKIGKYELDEDQTKVVLDDSKYALVVAGAGSGKTLTILGKIHYLVNHLNIKESEILCISFTNQASFSLKNKIKNELNLDINVYTFHKLGMNILMDEHYEIAYDSLLDEIVNEAFDIITKEENNIIFKYLKIKNICEYLKEINKVNNLKLLVIKFIRLFKSNNYNIENYLMFYKKISNIFNIFNYSKEKLFLILSLNIYLYYQKYLDDNHEIDFDDMLIYSKKYVDKHGYINNLKYIIIDEFQDTSIVRFELIKSILDKTNANLLVVGDDFQSIYRFTGCDLNLFINFNKYFKDAKILKIENTYRNSKELIKVAGDFVMKNKEQIKKDLKSNKSLTKPIVIVYFDNKSCLKKIIDLIDTDILILGRNNKDIYEYLTEDMKLEEDNIIYKDKKIKYLTVHKSKGLESDNVIVLNLINSILGFPNKMVDNKILRLVSHTSNSFPYEEERRLFYVALTRTKNKVYLLTKKSNVSIFIKELINNYKKEIEEIYL